MGRDPTVTGFDGVLWHQDGRCGRVPLAVLVIDEGAEWINWAEVITPLIYHPGRRYNVNPNARL